MARLPALPSIDIIHGFQGVLDFYLWKGLPCVRKWPYTPPSHFTEGTKATRTLFGAISRGYSLLGDGALQAFHDDAADQPRTARDIYMAAVYGHLHERTEPPPPPPPEEQMYDAYVCLRDLKPQNTQGGDFATGAWRTRDLNEEQADTADICTLAGNQFTLPAGSYRIMASCPAYKVDCHQTRLQNVTDGITLLVGSSERAQNADFVANRSFIAGRFTLGDPKTIQIQHRCAVTRLIYGLGRSGNFTDEIYTIVEIWRETEPE